MREEVKDSFDEFSPITGELTVLVEDSYRMDLGTGYQNMKDVWTINSPEAIQELENQLPAYILPFKFIDTVTGNIWYPILAFKHSGVLFPIADQIQGFKWGVSKVEKLKDKEDINTHFVVNLPIVVNGKEEMGLFKVNNVPIKVFDKIQFEEAFDLYNSLVEEDDQK